MIPQTIDDVRGFDKLKKKAKTSAKNTRYTYDDRLSYDWNKGSFVKSRYREKLGALFQVLLAVLLGGVDLLVGGGADVISSNHIIGCKMQKQTDNASSLEANINKLKKAKSKYPGLEMLIAYFEGEHSVEMKEGVVYAGGVHLFEYLGIGSMYSTAVDLMDQAAYQLIEIYSVAFDDKFGYKR